MKTQEWLAELRERLLADSNWETYLSPSGGSPDLRFRRKPAGALFCPITAFYYLKTGKHVSMTQWLSVRGELTLSQSYRIMRAADGLTHDPIRKALQEIWGMIALRAAP